MDNLGHLIKSIRTLQQQPTDELDQFILQCQVSETIIHEEEEENEQFFFLQNKDRELTQHRHELQRVRQALTEVILLIQFKVLFLIKIYVQITHELHPDDTRQLMQKLK